MGSQHAADRLRARIGAAIFERVAGPQGPTRRQQINQTGERWFAEDRPVRQVHGGHAMVRAIRWATSAPPPTAAQAS